MMFKYIFFLLFSSSLLLADDFVCKKQVSNSEAELIKLQNHYEKIDSITADFTQISYLAALDLKEDSSGKLWMQKSGNFRWHYSLPEEQDYLIKDNAFWHYQALDLQLNINSIEDLDLADLPISFLLGLGDISKDFKTEGTCLNSKSNLIFNLNPKSKEAAGLSQLILVVNRQDMQLLAVQIKDLSDNINQLFFKKVVLNQKLNDNVFVINYPDNVFVNDLRQE